MWSGSAYSDEYMESCGYTEQIPNPIFRAKFRVNDIHWGRSSFSVIVEECECPVIAALKGEYGTYEIVGNGARDIVLKALKGELGSDLGEKGWFEGVFTFAKVGSSYAIRLYDGE